jgi:hypothetical protein
LSAIHRFLINTGQPLPLVAAQKLLPVPTCWLCIT